MGAGFGTIPLPPVREKDPAADGARAGFRDMLRCQRSFQHGIKGQHRRTEIAAITKMLVSSYECIMRDTNYQFCEVCRLQGFKLEPTEGEVIVGGHVYSEMN